MIYICNPTINHECDKSGCLFYGLGECFSTLNEEYAVRNPDTQMLIGYEKENYETVAKTMIGKWREFLGEALEKAILHGTEAKE